MPGGGEYLLIASTDKDLSNKKALVGARMFYVSAISFVNNTEDFFVLNRDNGQPLANASVQVWEQKYEYKTSKYITEERTKLYKTDANGFFKKEKQKEPDNNRYGNYFYLLDISHNNDRLFMSDLVYDHYYYRDNSATERATTTSIFLFTDRSIYRPGQTVYFQRHRA